MKPENSPDYTHGYNKGWWHGFFAAGGVIIGTMLLLEWFS